MSQDNFNKSELKREKLITHLIHQESKILMFFNPPWLGKILKFECPRLAKNALPFSQGLLHEK